MKPIEMNRSLDFNFIRIVGYYFQRLVTQPILRAVVIHILRRFVGTRKLSHKSDSKRKEALSTLRADGIAPLGQVFTEKQCAEILHFLKDKPLSHRTYPGGTFSAEAPPEHVRLGNYALADLLQCPHILASVNNTEMIELARSYLGCTPTISGLSARWSFPSESSNEVVQQFHRDSEDWAAFRIMVYLTDVVESSGPHVYVLGTRLVSVSIQNGSSAKRAGRDSDSLSIRPACTKARYRKMPRAFCSPFSIPSFRATCMNMNRSWLTIFPMIRT
jgi:hypothetical protein